MPTEDTFISNRYLEVKISDYKRVSSLLEYIQKNRSPTKRVETSNDWQVVTTLYNFWKREQPLEYKFFMDAVQRYKNAYENNKFGEMIDQATGKKSAMELRHSLEIPERFYNIFTSVYPEQQWDKEFIRKFLKEIPELNLLSGKLTNV